MDVVEESYFARFGFKIIIFYNFPIPQLPVLQTFYAMKNKLSWWRHQMETFQLYWPFVRGIHRSPQWRADLMLSLICAWINNRVNNGEAGDLNANEPIVTSL